VDDVPVAMAAAEAKERTAATMRARFMICYPY
jgi:hypothetical protein